MAYCVTSWYSQGTISGPIDNLTWVSEVWYGSGVTEDEPTPPGESWEYVSRLECVR